MLTGRIFKIGLIVMLILSARVVSAQGTTTFLSNVGQPSTGSESVSSDSWIAAEFETGTNASGYLLDSVQLGMNNSTGSPSGFTVMLYANRNPSGFIPGSSLATFMGPLDPSTSATYTYTAPAGLALSSFGTYYIVVTAGTAVADGSYQWNFTSAVNYDSNDGWSGAALFESVNGTTWTEPPDVGLQFALIGSVAPEPGVMGLLVVGGVGLILWKKARGARVLPDGHRAREKQL